MTLNTSTVVADTDILASQYNDLRKDIIELGGEYAVATGSGGAYAVTIDSQITSLATGFTVKFKANHTYSGSPTLNINGIGAVNISNLSTVTSGRIYIGVYDGTGPDFVLFEANVNQGIVLTSGEDISQGDLISLKGGQAVKAKRESFGAKDTVAPTSAFDATTNCTILRNTDTQAVAFYKNNIDLIEVDETDQSISIADNESDTGATSEYGQTACNIDTGVFASVRYNGGAIDVTVISISGSTITTEDSVQLVASGADNNYFSIAKVDTNKFAVCYEDGTDVVIVGCSYSGGTITVDSANQFTRTGTDTAQWAIVPYATDEIIFFYDDVSDDDVYRQKITFSGTVPTGGTSTVLSANTSFQAVIVSDSFVGLVVVTSSTLHYSIKGSDTWANKVNVGSSFECIVEIENYEGNKFTLVNGAWTGGDDTRYNATLKNNSSGEVSVITYGQAVISVVDLDNNIFGSSVTLGTPNTFNHIYGCSNLHMIQGVAANSASNGDNVLIVTNGIVGGYSSLTKGTNYYYDVSDLSTLVANWGHYKIGTAVSTTEINVCLSKTAKPTRYGFTTTSNSALPLNVFYHFAGAYSYGVAGAGVFIEEGEDKFLSPSNASEVAYAGTYSYNTPNLLIVNDDSSVTGYITNEFAL